MDYRPTAQAIELEKRSRRPNDTSESADQWTEQLEVNGIAEVVWLWPYEPMPEVVIHAAFNLRHYHLQYISEA